MCKLCERDKGISNGIVTSDRLAVLEKDHKDINLGKGLACMIKAMIAEKSIFALDYERVKLLETGADAILGVKEK